MEKISHRYDKITGRGVSDLGPSQADNEQVSVLGGD